MAPLLIPMRHLILFLVLIHSVTLYKIYAFDDYNDDRTDLSNKKFLSSLYRDENNQAPYGYVNEDINSPIRISDMKENDNDDESIERRSIFSKRFLSSKMIPQRRNNPKHWNPLVAAYKRCAELSRAEERESCLKDAIQKIFLHRLRK